MKKTFRPTRRLAAAAALVALGSTLAAAQLGPALHSVATSRSHGGSLTQFAPGAQGRTTGMAPQPAADSTTSGGGTAVHSIAVGPPAMAPGTKLSAAGQGSAGSSATDQQPMPPVPVGGGIPDGPKVERSAQVSLETKHDGFDNALNSLFALVTEQGGYVAGSDLHTETDTIRSGTVSFKVPAGNFTITLQKLRGLATVKQLNVGGNDVSQEYVDLQARLRNDESQDAALQALLGRAYSIGDIIQIRNQLATVEGEMEQLKGRINFLDHSTAYSTFSVTLAEAPAVAASASPDAWGLKTAFVTAAHRFVDSVTFLVVALGVLAPYGLIAIGMGLVFRRRRPTAGSTPAAA